MIELCYKIIIILQTVGLFDNVKEEKVQCTAV